MLHHQGGVFLETWELTSNIFTQKVRLKKSIFKIWIFLLSPKCKQRTRGPEPRQSNADEGSGDDGSSWRGFAKSAEVEEWERKSTRKIFHQKKKIFFQRKILLEIILVPYFKSRVQERLSHKCAPFL